MHKARTTIVLVLSLSVAGCATKAGTGAAAGGVLGGALGAIVGHQTGNTAAGAALGTGLGAVTGAVVGSSVDETDRRNADRLAAERVQRSVTVYDVVTMTQSGVQEETIVASIRSSGAVFRLTATDVVALHNQGVSDRVLQTMMEARPLPLPIVDRRPVYVVEPYQPHIMVGYGYGCHHHCW